MNICAECHKKNRGCCQLIAGNTDSMHGLSQYEIDRISSTMKLNESDFICHDTVKPEVMNGFRKLDSLFDKLIPQRERARLKIIDNACVFLKPDGCSLPMEARPYYCRLYPFWFNRDSHLIVIRSRFCLAQEQSLSVVSLLEAIGTTEAELLTLYRELQHAAGNPKES
ncbi:MAG: YkgJ family cysteine cluster protein [Candidatus Cloacimonetes bacterium]|nr:YkgJ family cysteine cluster protein [Candidatus Cloacimonadota bacterium]